MGKCSAGHRELSSNASIRRRRIPVVAGTVWRCGVCSSRIRHTRRSRATILLRDWGGGPDKFDRELTQWRDSVLSGAAKVAAEVERFNDELPVLVARFVDEHVGKAQAAAKFTAVPFAVTRRPDAPPKVVAPPSTAIERDVPPSGRIPAAQPALGRYFDDILAVLESALRSIPARHRQRRDHRHRPLATRPDDPLQRGSAPTPIARRGPTRLVCAREERSAIEPCERSSCLKATAMVLDLHPIGSSRAPSLCLCTGRNASGQVALPWVVAKRAPRRHRLRTPAFMRERGAECRKRIPIRTDRLR